MTQLGKLNLTFAYSEDENPARLMTIEEYGCSPLICLSFKPVKERGQHYISWIMNPKLGKEAFSFEVSDFYFNLLEKTNQECSIDSETLQRIREMEGFPRDSLDFRLLGKYVHGNSRMVFPPEKIQDQNVLALEIQKKSEEWDEIKSNPLNQFSVFCDDFGDMGLSYVHAPWNQLEEILPSGIDEGTQRERMILTRVTNHPKYTPHDYKFMNNLIKDTIMRTLNKQHLSDEQIVVLNENLPDFIQQTLPNTEA